MGLIFVTLNPKLAQMPKCIVSCIVRYPVKRDTDEPDVELYRRPEAFVTKELGEIAASMGC